MRIVELSHRPVNPQDFLARFCDLHGLMLSPPLTLASSPGAAHWHLIRPKISGVLEVTWDPVKDRTWFKVAKNRDAPWIGAVIDLLLAQMDPS